MIDDWPVVTPKKYMVGTLCCTLTFAVIYCSITSSCLSFLLPDESLDHFTYTPSMIVQSVETSCCWYDYRFGIVQGMFSMLPLDEYLFPFNQVEYVAAFI